MTDAHKIVWAPIALNDLEEILDYIAANDSSDAAVHVGNKILSQVDTLVQHPTRCRMVPELREVGVTEYRELIVRPYRIVFRIERKRVGLVAVVDGRRDLEELLISRTLR